MRQRHETVDYGGRAAAEALPRDLVAYEAISFLRRDGEVDITVQGMTAAENLELTPSRVLHDRLTVSVLGTPSPGEVRPFSLSTTVAEDVGWIIVQGLNRVEGVSASSLPLGLPIVCGADPTAVRLDGAFLHRRGDRYVLMQGPGGTLVQA